MLFENVVCILMGVFIILTLIAVCIWMIYWILKGIIFILVIPFAVPLKIFCESLAEKVNIALIEENKKLKKKGGF